MHHPLVQQKHLQDENVHVRITFTAESMFLAAALLTLLGSLAPHDPVQQQL